MMMQPRFAVYFMAQQRKYGTALYKRAVVQNKSIYMFKAQMERGETMLTSIATQSHAWTLYHSYCSLEHSVTFGACAECQLPLREPESLSPSLSLPALLNVTNLPRALIHVPSPQLFLIPVQIINPWSYRR